jgi:hypothetical protein
LGSFSKSLVVSSEIIHNIKLLGIVWLGDVKQGVDSLVWLGIVKQGG